MVVNLRTTPPPMLNKPVTAETKEVSQELKDTPVNARSSAGDVFVVRNAIDAERDKESANSKDSPETEASTSSQETIQDKASRMFEFMAFIENQKADNPGKEPDPVDTPYDYGVSDADLYGENDVLEES